jgi:hypothetical protein
MSVYNVKTAVSQIRNIIGVNEIGVESRDPLPKTDCVYYKKIRKYFLCKIVLAFAVYIISYFYCLNNLGITITQWKRIK